MKKSAKPIKPKKRDGKKMRCAEQLHARGKMTPLRFKSFKNATRQSRLTFI